MTLTAEFIPQILNVSIDTSKMGAVINPPIVKEYVNAEAYMGEYEVTPSDETQILYTENKRMISVVTINPIPNNYGKIEMKGAVLTVS